MTDISQLFLYIPGIIIFLVGSGQVRRWMRMRRQGACADGTVISCNHIVKKDKKDQDIYNYYDVLIEYTDQKSKHQVRQNLKSPSEYAVGQDVRIFWGTESGKPELTEAEEEQLFNPWVMMCGGALLILLALFQNQGHQIRAMICLSAVLIGAGASMLWNFISLKRRNLTELPGEIVEVFSRQISRGTKILRGDRFTYYPVVKYELNGKENIRRCNINSSSANTFKTGESFPLFYDEDKKTVIEKNARISIAVLGAASLIAGILAGLSILSVIL